MALATVLLCNTAVKGQMLLSVVLCGCSKLVANRMQNQEGDQDPGYTYIEAAD